MTLNLLNDKLNFKFEFLKNYEYENRNIISNRVRRTTRRS